MRPFPKGLLRWAKLGAVGIVVVLAAQAIALWQGLSGLLERDRRLHAAGHEVMRLDEVLTLSTDLYAALNDECWRERFAAAEVRLLDVFEQTRRQVLDASARAALEALAQASRALFAMEHAAMDPYPMGSTKWVSHRFGLHHRFAGTLPPQVRWCQRNRPRLESEGNAFGGNHLWTRFTTPSPWADIEKVGG